MEKLLNFIYTDQLIFIQDVAGIKTINIFVEEYELLLKIFRPDLIQTRLVTDFIIPDFYLILFEIVF